MPRYKIVPYVDAAGEHRYRRFPVGGGKEVGNPGEGYTEKGKMLAEVSKLYPDDVIVEDSAQETHGGEEASDGEG